MTTDPHTEALATLENLVEEWLTLPDIAELWGCEVAELRRLLDDGELIAVKRGSPKVLSIPAELVSPVLVERLGGTITVLLDGGFSIPEALVWLLTVDESLQETPIASLRAGKRAEIRRRAAALAF